MGIKTSTYAFKGLNSAHYSAYKFVKAPREKYTKNFYNTDAIASDDAYVNT